MSEDARQTVLRGQTAQLLQGRLRHVRAVALAAALVPLGALAVSAAVPTAAQSGGTGGGGTGGGGTPACTINTAIVSNFNGTPIAAGSVIWFNAVLKVKGATTGPVTVSFTNGAIQVGASPPIPVPNAVITLGSGPATTMFSGGWVTSVPIAGLAGNTFLDGVAVTVPAGGLPGGLKPITWSGTFNSDTPGVTISWQWAAAVYVDGAAPVFSDYNSLNVKPVDDNKASLYQNSDHAGTPESAKTFVVGGARGGGGSNFTGSYSGTQSTECVPPEP